VNLPIVRAIEMISKEVFGGENQKDPSRELGVACWGALCPNRPHANRLKDQKAAEVFCVDQFWVLASIKF